MPRPINRPITRGDRVTSRLVKRAGQTGIVIDAPTRRGDTCFGMRAVVVCWSDDSESLTATCDLRRMR